MENALMMTGLLILAALAGGVIGSACARKRNDPDAETEGRLADLEDRLDALADHVMDQTHAIRERVAECELLIGETPDDGLLNRVGAMEEAHRKEDLLTRVNLLTDEVRTIGGRFDTFEGGASLELSGLRKSVEALEGKANG